MIHSVGEAAEPERPIGESGAALVKRDDARETRHVIERMAVERRVIDQIEMRYESGYVHDVDRPIAHDLVGDVDIAGTTGIPDVSTARHRLPPVEG